MMDPVLKQRLIGVGVIWLLALIFLPMILGGDRESSSTRQQLGLPAELDQPRETRRVTLDESESPESRVATEAPSSPPPVDDETGPVAETVPAPEAEEAAPDEPVPEAGHAVQVGSFSNRDNAEALAARLRERDYRVDVSRYRREDTVLYRVRVGPVATSDEADVLLEELQQRMGLNGRVVTHP